MENNKCKCTVLVCILVIIFSLSACKPTPENISVINKNDGELESKISASAQAAEGYSAPQTWKESFVSKDERVNIEINAQINVPDVAQYPVVNVGPLDISQKIADNVLNTLIGDNTIYAQSDTMTKSDIEYEIDYAQNFLTNELPGYEKTDPEYYKQKYAATTEWLEYLYGLLETTTDVAPKVVSKNFTTPEIDNSDDAALEVALKEQGLSDEEIKGLIAQSHNQQQLNQEIIGEVDLGKKCKARIDLFKFSTVNQGVWFSNTDSGNSVGELFDILDGNQDCGILYDDALQIASDAIQNMGICNAELYQAGYVKVNQADNEDQANAYFFIFTRNIDGIPITHVEKNMSISTGQSFSEHWPDEILRVCVDKTGIIDFQWRYPINIKETINDNVELLPFEDIQNNLQNHLQTEYAWNESEGDNAISRTIIISRIELGLVRVAQKNSTGYMLIPAWDFFGYTVDKYEEQQPGGYQLDENNEYVDNKYGTSFLTINAIDGSIIDRNLGY
mgnify:CR=1 FL=1